MRRIACLLLAAKIIFQSCMPCEPILNFITTQKKLKGQKFTNRTLSRMTPLADYLASYPNAWSKYHVTSWRRLNSSSVVWITDWYCRNHGWSKASYAFLCFYYFCSLHCVLLRRLFKSWTGTARAKEKNKRSWKPCGGQVTVKRRRHKEYQECSW